MNKRNITEKLGTGMRAYTIDSFIQAVAHVEKKKKKRLFIHLMERAYVNDKVLCLVLNKFVPDIRPFIPEDEETKKLIGESLEILQTHALTVAQAKERFQPYLNLNTEN